MIEMSYLKLYNVVEKFINNIHWWLKFNQEKNKVGCEACREGGDPKVIIAWLSV